MEKRKGIPGRGKNLSKGQEVWKKEFTAAGIRSSLDSDVLDAIK